MLICSLLFQLSQTAWPAQTIHDNFYDLYIANRSYERYYRTLFDNKKSSRQRKDLYDKVTKHFLVVQIYIESNAAVQVQDRPRHTTTSIMSQLGGILNLWAGITVVVAIELIEFCYEVVTDKFTRRSQADKGVPDRREVNNDDTTGDQSTC